MACATAPNSSGSPTTVPVPYVVVSHVGCIPENQGKMEELESYMCLKVCSLSNIQTRGKIGRAN